MSSFETPAVRPPHGAPEGTPQILVVDDNRALLSIIGEILVSHGYEPALFACANHALRALETLTPHLIVSDIIMPCLDGWSFHSKLSGNPDWASIPFVFLTSCSSPEEIRQAKSLGCDDFLTKPFEPDDFLAVIEGKLRLTSRREAARQRSLDTKYKRIIQTLSHEFRTPLVSITTGTELVLERLEDLDSATLCKLLESIKRGGTRLQRLVEDFVLLQQIQLGYAAQLYREFHRVADLNSLCERAVQTFQESYGEQHPDLTIDWNRLAGRPLVRVCEPQIESCIQRVLANAIKFAGTEHPIEVSLGNTSPGSVAIVITDRGPGIAIPRLEEACDLFTQLDRDVLEQQGCGLGLPITKHLLAINGASLSFALPERHSGLRVIFTFTHVGDEPKE